MGRHSETGTAVLQRCPSLLTIFAASLRQEPGTVRSLCREGGFQKAQSAASLPSLIQPQSRRTPVILSSHSLLVRDTSLDSSHTRTALPPPSGSRTLHSHSAMSA